jgi:tryptophan synthase alpha chain
MTYLNPILQYGLSELDRDASAAGLDGILISDLTPEEYLLMSDPEETRINRGLFQQLDTVFLTAPNSSNERIKLISSVSTGFVYLIARTGVTGKRTHIDEALCQSVERVRDVTDLPIAVGFGIRSKSDVENVWRYADAAIVGSAIVQFVDEHQLLPDLASRAGDYVRDQLIPAG